MSLERENANATGALGSVRQLEMALEETSAARTAAEAHLREARSEAERLLAVARDDAAAADAERRRVVLAAADRDTARILSEGEARATQIRAEASETREATVEAALELILPVVDEREI